MEIEGFAYVYFDRGHGPAPGDALMITTGTTPDDIACDLGVDQWSMHLRAHVGWTVHSGDQEIRVSREIYTKAESVRADVAVCLERLQPYAIRLQGMCNP